MKIENVTTVKSYKNKIYYIKNDGKLFEYNNIESLKESIETNAHIYFSDNRMYIVSSDNGILIGTYPSTNSICNFSISRIENDLVYFRDGGLFNSVFGLAKIDRNDFKLLIPLGVLNILVSYNDFVIGEHEDFIVCKNYKEDNLLWKFPLSELGVDPYEPQKADSIKDILGVVNGYLWIQTGAYKIIALNLENGNKKVVTEGFHAYLDKRNGKIYTLSSNIVAIIDTLNFIVEEEYNFLEEDSLGIGKYKSIYAPLHQGDYFTFIAEKENDYGGSRYIGVFDYAKRELVWDYEVFTQEEINQTRNKLVPPQKLYITEDGRKMYIKDFHDTLHVFEREF